MAEAYLTADDLIMRLHQSVCLYDGEPYFVSCVPKFPKVGLHALGGKNNKYDADKIIDHTDERFSDRSPPLGYMTYENNAYYLERVPYRQQNQGLKQVSVVSSPHLDHYSPWFRDATFRDCILGKHASIKEAWKLMDKGYRGVSIHRNVAIRLIDTRSIGLYYKTRLVATRKGDMWDWLPATDGKYIQKIINRLGVL